MVLHASPQTATTTTGPLGRMAGPPTPLQPLFHLPKIVLNKHGPNKGEVN